MHHVWNTEIELEIDDTFLSNAVMYVNPTTMRKSVVVIAGNTLSLMAKYTTANPIIGIAS
jgi:hypothetical protein